MGVFRFWFPGQTGVNLADGILHAEHGEEAVKQKRQQQGREQETQANDDAGRDLPEVIKLRNQIPDGGDPQVNMPCTRRFIIQADFIAVFAEDVARGWIFSIFVNLLIVRAAGTAQGFIGVKQRIARKVQHDKIRRRISQQQEILIPVIVDGDHQGVGLWRAVRVQLIENEGIVIVVAVLLITIFMAVYGAKTLVHRPVSDKLPYWKRIYILQFPGKEGAGGVNSVGITIINIDGLGEISGILGTV